MRLIFNDFPFVIKTQLSTNDSIIEWVSVFIQLTMHNTGIHQWNSIWSNQLGAKWPPIIFGLHFLEFHCSVRLMAEHISNLINTTPMHGNCMANAFKQSIWERTFTNRKHKMRLSLWIALRNVFIATTAHHSNFRLNVTNAYVQPIISRIEYLWHVFMLWYLINSSLVMITFVL